MHDMSTLWQKYDPSHSQKSPFVDFFGMSLKKVQKCIPAVNMDALHLNLRLQNVEKCHEHAPFA